MSSSLIPHRLNRFPIFSSINTWNSQMREAVNQNNPPKALLLYRELKRNGLEPNNLTFPFVAKACSRIFNLRNCEIIHSHVVKSPFCFDVFVQTTMVDMYVKCSQLDYAYKVFERMPERDVASWNAMLVGFAHSGLVNKVLCLFSEMRSMGIDPDSVTVMALTQSAMHLNNLEFLKSVHSFGIRIGIDADVSVGNTWISAYSKCSDLSSAKLVFDGIEKGVRTIVSWNSLIAACANFNNVGYAFGFYQSMLREELRPDISTIVSLVASCSQPEELSQGRLIHSHAIHSGCDQDIAVINTFISMYSKCGDICSARVLFDGMSTRTCVSWTVMISGFAENGNMDEALALFLAMQKNGENPDLVTLLSLISGCGQMGSLEIGKRIEGYADVNGFKGNNVMVCNALIDMYSKCGSTCNARDIFNGMSEKTVVTWTAMISGYALNGTFTEALKLFDEMIQSNYKPNHITFLAVLQACAHSGFLQKGWEYFKMMEQDYNIEPGLDHHSCMVDLLGRKGKLKEALEVIQNIKPKPDAGILGALLSACKIHRNVEVGEYVATVLFYLEPHVAAPYVEMANIYACAGMWDGVARIRSMMKCNKVKKYPGESVVEVKGKNHVFRVEDRGHPKGDMIYKVLYSLSLLAKDEGYAWEFEGIVEQVL